MKYLHLMQNDKFNKFYIEFIENNFDMKDHYFIFWGGINEKEIPIPKKNNIYIVDNLISILRIIDLMNKSVKIYLHGLFSRKIMLMIYLQPWVLKRCNWIAWGGDLYSYKDKKQSVQSKIFEKIKAKIIRNVAEVSTLVKGDYDLAKKWYDVKGKYKEAFYMSPFIEPSEMNYKPTNNESLYIQIGNSAAKENNHIEALDMLMRYKDENIKIFCPLSYGDEQYAKSIEEYGKEVFGEKFIPIKHFMPYEEYIKYLNTIDIGIFNNDRQQALGNINRLILNGKKVYVRTDTTMWNFFKNQFDLNVYDINQIKNLDINKFSYMNDKDRYVNIKNLSYRYTDKYAFDIWKKNFEI